MLAGGGKPFSVTNDHRTLHGVDYLPKMCRKNKLINVGVWV